MDQYVIKGGNPLVGDVAIGGAKNAALAILAAAVMTDETVTIDNLPNVRDINVMLQAIENIGATVERIDVHTVKINGSTIHETSVDNEYIRKIRASYYLLGALLGKYKDAEVALPGGCAIGSRPIDLHLKGFRAMGAEIDIHHGLVAAKADRLCGTHIYMDKVSVGATINIMMAAAMAEGKTIIENAAKEPHVVDVANFLNRMGANIRGAGTDVIRISGVEKLHKTENSTWAMQNSQSEQLQLQTNILLNLLLTAKMEKLVQAKLQDFKKQSLLQHSTNQSAQQTLQFQVQKVMYLMHIMMLKETKLTREQLTL